MIIGENYVFGPILERINNHISSRIVDAIAGWRTIVRGRHLRRVTGYEIPATGTRVAEDTDASAHVFQKKPAFLAEVLTTSILRRAFGADSDLRRWGVKTGGARREKCEEASRGCGGEKASGTAASVVGEWRGVRTTA
jgi:hypothetical protein